MNLSHLARMIPAFLVSILKHHWGLVCVAVAFSGFLFANLIFPNALPPYILRYMDNDFSQVYMGAVAVQTQSPDCLYPVSVPVPPETALLDRSRSLYLTGIVQEPLCSTLQARGWWRGSVYIYPPPLAHFVLPFAFLPYFESSRIYLILLLGATLLSLGMMERVFRSHQSLTPFWTQVVIVLCGCSLPVLHGIIPGNINLLLLPFLAATLHGIAYQKTGWIVTGFLAGALTKGFTVFWVPLLFCFRQWRVIGWGALVSSLILLGSLAQLGLAVYHDFLTRIIPESRFPYAITAGLPSVFASLFPTSLYSQILSPLLKILECLTYGFIYYLAFRCHRHTDSRPLAVSISVSHTMILAQFACLVTFTLFSPLCWPHSLTLFFPFIPWVWNRFRHAKLHKTLFILTGILLPLGPLTKYALHCQFLDYLGTPALVCLLVLSLSALSRHPQ